MRVTDWKRRDFGIRDLQTSGFQPRDLLIMCERSGGIPQLLKAAAYLDCAAPPGSLFLESVAALLPGIVDS